MKVGIPVREVCCWDLNPFLMPELGRPMGWGACWGRVSCEKHQLREDVKEGWV